MTNDLATKDHWNSYYSRDEVPTLPSQFAVFMLNEVPDAKAVVEFGCGNGRDSHFFARHGYPVIGLDASKEGVAGCVDYANRNRLNARFICSDVAASGIVDTVLEQLASVPPGRILVYARFFIHAIPEDVERALLANVSAILRQRGGVFGAEFRTNRDSQLAKVTPTHYRRFVDPNGFMVRASEVGLKSDYSVEGFGLAKFRNDDAHVARFILSLAETEPAA